MPRIIFHTSNHEKSACDSWVKVIAGTIDHINSSSCPQHLVSAIGTLVEFDMAMSVVYSCRHKPLYVCDTFPTEKARQGLSNYINSTYVLNPVYAACLCRLNSGVYRIYEILSENRISHDYYNTLKIKRILGEELEYITECWPRNMEEIFITISLPEDEMGEISLLRAKSKGGFADTDIALLSTHLPLIEAIYQQYWTKFRCYPLTDDTVTSIDCRLKTVFDSQLSVRENQVATLILKGISGQDIADELGICLSTVKTHRKNLYTKLGIATQIELFFLALKALTPYI